MPFALRCTNARLRNARARPRSRTGPHAFRISPSMLIPESVSMLFPPGLKRWQFHNSSARSFHTNSINLTMSRIQSTAQ